MTNPDERFEQHLAELLADIAPIRQPADLVIDVERAIDGAARWPRWLADLKEPPMRLASGIAVGSPIARMSTLIIATLLMSVVATGAAVAGAQLLFAAGPIVVDADGGGDATTIAEAVAQAGDGRTILVRPGIYPESITITGDIEIRGAGSSADVVIVATEGASSGSSAILLRGSDAAIVGMTFRGEHARVRIDGGSPRLDDLVFEDVGSFDGSGKSGSDAGSFALVVGGGSTATVTASTFVRGGALAILDGSEPQVMDNELRAATIYGDPGDRAIIADNTIDVGDVPGASGIWMFGRTRASIEGNTIIGAGLNGISIGFETGVGTDPVVRGNTVIGSGTGIAVSRAADPLVDRNVLIDNGRGIWVTGSDVRIVGNQLTRNGDGILIWGGSPMLDGNTILDGKRGIVLANIAEHPVLVGNAVCGNAVELFVAAGLESPATDGNDICGLHDGA